MKSNVKYWQKATLSIKKYLPIQSTISRSSETSKHQSWNALIKIKINPIQNHWTTINAIGHPLRRRFLVPLAWSCFYGVPASSSLLWLVPRRSIFYKQCRYGMFWLGNLLWLNLVYILLLRIANIIKWASLKQGTYYKFHKNCAHCNFDCKYAQVLLLVTACFCSFPLLIWTVFPGARGRNIFLARPDEMSDSAITLQGIFLFYQTFCNKPNGNIIYTKPYVSVSRQRWVCLALSLKTIRYCD